MWWWSEDAFFNIFPTFHFINWVLDKFRTRRERKMLENIFNGEDPSINQNDKTSTKLVKWYENKKSELSEVSWTCKLWFSYIEYMFIVQFIWAERTNNWESLIATTNSMVIFFAVTRHNNYAKKCRLYIQSVEELKSINLSLYSQFHHENHTVRCTGFNWSVIWVDLSIEQMLTKSLRRRSGIIRRGITENVINVWTKIMHR